MKSSESIAIIGGTGALGSALAGRLARAGLEVIIGSRDAARAGATAEAIGQQIETANIRGDSNEGAARAGDMVVVTVPFASQQQTLEGIRSAVTGKLVVDTTVPLVPPRVARVQLPPAGCAAVICREALGDSARVISAFHNVSAEKLAAEGPLACDVLIFGDSVADREALVSILAGAGMRGIHGGPLVNSTAAEAMTSVLIAINRRYGVTGGAGICITGIDPEMDEATTRSGQ